MAKVAAGKLWFELPEGRSGLNFRNGSFCFGLPQRDICRSADINKNGLMKCAGVFITKSREFVLKTVSPKAHNYRVWSAAQAFPARLQTRLYLRLLYALLFTLLGLWPSSCLHLPNPKNRRTRAPNLEPSFEHLLCSSLVHESIIMTLRINDITDRDTFVNMFDSESTLRDGAADLGYELVWVVDSPHKREFARVVTAWENSKSNDRDQDPYGRCRPSSWCSCYLASRGLVGHDDRV